MGKIVDVLAAKLLDFLLNFIISFVP